MQLLNKNVSLSKMAKKIAIEFEYDFLNGLDHLSPVQKELVVQARKAAKKGYAPYSNFYVGAALELENGEIISGSNQENVAFSDGTCAERTAVFFAKSSYPNQAIERIAICANAKEFDMQYPISPCGSCRQVLAEYEQLQGKPIEIILASAFDDIYIIKGAAQLLPLLFYEKKISK